MVSSFTANSRQLKIYQKVKIITIDKKFEAVEIALKKSIEGVCKYFYEKNATDEHFLHFVSQFSQ